MCNLYHVLVNAFFHMEAGPEETPEQNSTSVQTGLTQVDSLSHSRTELGSERGDAVKYTREGGGICAVICVYALKLIYHD